jgi:tRNA A37 methylthiotransferase MiaB
MANPEHVKKYYKDLINIFKDKKIIKFLHLPVQSGSDKVLKDMKRDYTIKEFKKIVKEFRKEIPNICISTDIIVGYPTETEEDFKKTIELIKNLRFEVINVSKFASRPKTYASKLKQLQSQVIKERSKKISEILKEIITTKK